MAASLTKSGVSKSGSPAERPITSMPARFSSLTRPVMARVALGWMRPRAADVCDMETFPIWIGIRESADGWLHRRLRWEGQPMLRLQGLADRKSVVEGKRGSV